MRLQTMTPPPDVADLDNKITEMDRLKEEAVRDQDFEEAAKRRDEAYRLRRKREEVLQEWRESEEASGGSAEVNREIIAETVSRMTGVPVTNLGEEEALRLLKMEEELAQTVIHQEGAVGSISKAVRRSRSGLKDPNRPGGSFLFLGPSGVGKTWLSKQLAKFMFGDEEALLVFDMSDYMEKHNASRLVGSPPGYVGYEEGGQLTEKVRRRPYSVILFDEVEKAHPDVFNMLLQIMEEGRLVDSLGRYVDFRNSIIIMTSNIGAHLMREGGGVGFTASEEQTAERIKSGIMDEVNRFFRPEFLNRLDEIITFNPLTRKDLHSIIKLELAKVEERLRSKKLVLHLSDAARDFLIDRGFNPEFGARPLRRTIERHIEDALAEELLRGGLPEGSLVEMDKLEDEDGLSFTSIPPDAAEEAPEEVSEGSDSGP